MRRFNCFFVLFIILKSGTTLYAQEWKVSDSIWLNRILNGTETIRLNDETRKAIESGTFIRNSNVVRQLYNNPIEIQIIKSFEDIEKPKSRSILPGDVHVGVYKIYVLDQQDVLPVIRKEATTVRSGVGNNSNRSNRLGAGIVVNFSAENVLRTIFWPSHRAKMRNAKRANAWKTYNEGY